MPESRHRPALAGALVLLATGLVAAGGAATSGDGLLLGVPGAAAAAAVAAVVLAVWRWGRDRLAPALGLLPLLALLLAGVRWPGVWAWSGPPLAVVAGAVALAAVAPAAGRLRAWFFPIVLVVHLAAAARVQLLIGTEGDEPHYLMVAESLLRDGDVSLERDYAEHRYRAFYRKPELAPHYRVRGRDGEILSLHAIGLSVLLLPAYALGGYPAASFFMALLSAAAAREVRKAVVAWSGDEQSADVAGWVVGLGPPLVHYAGLVFTEVPAALVVAAVLARGGRPETSRATTLGLASASALLPWLNVRYAPVTIVLLGFLAWPARRDVRRLLALATPAAVSAAGVAAYHKLLYGFWDPRLVYGRRPEFSLATLPEGLQGLALDQEFGLLAYAPVFALALPGAWLARRFGLVRAGTLVALVGAVAVTAGSWHMWRGGWNPPARFLVPVVPALALLVALGSGRARRTAVALLAAWGLWTGLTGVWDPTLVHRDRDGTAPLFRAHSGAVEWTTLLPAYVLSEPDRARLALVWAGLLALAAWPVAAPRRPTAAGWAIASAALVGAAGLAAARSDGSSEGRTAARLLGRTAVAVPGLDVLTDAPARFGPEAVNWDGVYEPHRFPDGVTLARRLPLDPGRYRIALKIATLGAPGAPPILWLDPDGPRERDLRERLRRTVTGLEADFEVAGDAAVTLGIVGGDPLRVEEITLSIQPSAPGPV